MKMKQLLALVMCAAMLFVICACKPKQPTDTTTDGTSGSDTSGTTASVLSTQQIQTEAIRIPVEEIANAIKIDAQPITETKEIPLIIILANFDADGDGENDWDENDTDKLYSEMQKSAIFVLSSRYEGFGLVLLEAQAAGLPCVSFDCKEGPREIIDNGINGFLVREGDTNELSERILLLIKNTALRRSFSKNSQKDLYRFTPEKILKEWNTVLEEISRD